MARRCKNIYQRPLRWAIVVHPFFLAQEDTFLLKGSAFLSCAKTSIDDSRLVQRQARDVEQKQKNEKSNSTVMWSLLTNTIPHGRTIMHMVTPATEASMMAVGPFSEIFDPGKNGLQLTDDSVKRLKNEFATNDRMSFSHAFHVRTTTWIDVLRCVRSKCSCCKT